jgi:hypothetical protein
LCVADTLARRHQGIAPELFLYARYNASPVLLQAHGVFALGRPTIFEQKKWAFQKAKADPARCPDKSKNA